MSHSEGEEMIFAALSEAANVGELLLVDGGMCRFHGRKDGVVTIREIIVLPERRRKGIGRALVDRVKFLFPQSTIRATCPGEYESNKFWESIGFICACFKPPDGRMRVWECRT